MLCVTQININIKIRRGGRARFMAPVLKIGVGVSLPWVQIPPSPPNGKLEFRNWRLEREKDFEEFSDI